MLELWFRTYQRGRRTKGRRTGTNEGAAHVFASEMIYDLRTKFRQVAVPEYVLSGARMDSQSFLCPLACIENARRFALSPFDPGALKPHRPPRNASSIRVQISSA